MSRRHFLYFKDFSTVKQNGYCSDFIWDFGKLPFPTHLGKYFIRIGKIRAKIYEIGKIKAIFGLGMTPIYGLKNGQIKSLYWLAVSLYCSQLLLRDWMSVSREWFLRPLSRCVDVFTPVGWHALIITRPNIAYTWHWLSIKLSKSVKWDVLAWSINKRNEFPIRRRDINHVIW